MSEVLSDAWRKEHVKKGDDRSDEGDRPVTDIDLDAIRARADAATPGPWELTGLCEDPGDEGWWIHNGNQGADEYAVALSLPYNPRGEADAEFIAAARADVPTLIARLAEVEAERDGKEAALVAAEEVLARLALRFTINPQAITEILSPAEIETRVIEYLDNVKAEVLGGETT